MITKHINLRSFQSCVKLLNIQFAFTLPDSLKDIYITVNANRIFGEYVTPFHIERQIL